MGNVKRRLCSIIAYLIGVRETNFYLEDGERGLQQQVFEELDGQPAAQIVRDLCTLRYRMIRNNGDIRNAFRQDNRNILTLEKKRTPDGREFELLPRGAIDRLYRNGVDVFMNRPNVFSYLISFNTRLRQQLDRPDVQRLFPPEVNWRYIREIMLFPPGTTERNVLESVQDYYIRRKDYPYGCYINWDGCSGNILSEDDQFLRLLYERNEDCWHGEEKENDIAALGLFLRSGENPLILVDCATTDLASMEAVQREAGDLFDGTVSQTVLICPAVMKAHWSPLAERLKAELREVSEAYAPCGEKWQNVLLDEASDVLLNAAGRPHVLVTGDTDFFRRVYDIGFVDREYLILTGRACKDKWTGPDQQEHLCLLPDAAVESAQKSGLALARIRARLAACQLPGVGSLLTQAVSETPYAFTEEELNELYERCSQQLCLTIDSAGALQLQLR